jgi:hypothetical protein
MVVETEATADRKFALSNYPDSFAALVRAAP